MSTPNNKLEIVKPTGRTTVSIATDAHRRAQIAAGLANESLLDYLTKAADTRSLPLLKKHGVRLPDDAAVVSRAA